MTDQTNPNPKEAVSDFSKALAERLLDLLPAVITECETAQRDFSGKSEDLAGIIKSYANRNITIGLETTSDLFNVKPWPLGSITELSLISANHIRMLFNIGKTFGKETSVLGLELLTAIMAKAVEFPEKNISLKISEGRTHFIRKNDATIKTYFNYFAEQASRQMEKARIVNFMSRLAPVAIATWGLVTAEVIGNLGAELLSRDIIFSSEGGSSSAQSEKGSQDLSKADAQFDLEKAKLLVNLLKDDHVPEDRKATLVEPFPEFSGFYELSLGNPD